MKKSALNPIVDSLLVIALVSVAFIGILLGFFIGRGAAPETGKFLWGLHRHDWGDLHLIFSLTLVSLVILHFILHLDWARHTSKRLLGLHWGLSLILLLLIAGAVLCTSIGIKRAYPGRWGREERAYGRGRHEPTRPEQPERPRRGESRPAPRRKGWRQAPLP